MTQKEEADYNPFQYVGKYGVMHLNDHQYYMRARHYDPTIGRFYSEDPIWSTNLYPYTDNNPILGIDPKGETLDKLGEATIELLKDANEYSIEVFQNISNGNNLVVLDEQTMADIVLELKLKGMDVAEGIKQVSPELIAGGSIGGAQLIASLPEWVITGSEFFLVGGMVVCVGGIAYDFYEIKTKGFGNDWISVGMDKLERKYWNFLDNSWLGKAVNNYKTKKQNKKKPW